MRNRLKLFLIVISIVFLQESLAQKDSVLEQGERLIYENKLDEAIEFYIEQLSQTSDNEKRSLMFLDLGTIYKLKAEFDESFSYYDKALDEIKLTNNKPLEFLYNVKMIEFYRKRGLYTEAIDYQEKAEFIRKTHSINEYYLAKYYGRRAALFNEHFGIADSIIKYANLSLDLAKKNSDLDNIFYSILEIASVYETNKEYKKAIEYYEELLANAKEYNLVQQQADVYINYSNSLIKDNQLKKGLQVSLEGLDFVHEQGLLFNEITLAINVYETYKKLGDIEKAYDYLLDRIILTEAYNTKVHDQYLFELEEKYKLTEKENEIKISRLEIENKNEALASSRTKLFISISLFVIAIFVTLLITYFLRKSRKRNKQLKSLSQENEFLLSEANHRINNNLQLVVILISDQLKKSGPDSNFVIKNILTKVEAISTLHKHLYKNEDKNKIDAQNYLGDVRQSFLEVFEDNSITTNLTIASIEIPSDDAMYFGLLLAELFINSIKHAFQTEQNKEITFQLEQENGILYFTYIDNGTNASNKTIKPKLIDKLCRQLKVNYTINTQRGFYFSFEKEIKND